MKEHEDLRKSGVEVEWTSTGARNLLGGVKIHIAPTHSELLETVTAGLQA